MSVLNKPVKPYTFVDGTGNLAYGSEVNANFDVLYNKVGDVIDVVNTTDYQTVVNTATLATAWASKTDGIVDTTDYSAKAYAIGGTGVSGAAGAAKEWAIKTNGTVDGSEYSAKYYAQAAAQVYDSFDDRYLGAKAADPALDNDGNALVAGALYFNTTSNVMRAYTGSAWQDNNAVADGSIATSKLADDSVTGSKVLFTSGDRIRGDFSNATIANRTMFQTSIPDGTTSVAALPGGNLAASSFVAYGLSDPNNSHFIAIAAPSGGAVFIQASKTGTGAYLPLWFYTGGAPRLNLATDGTFTSVSGAIGYGTGAGGTVTQATSKSTAVTLNKPCGQITMNNAALAAGASVNFQFNNSILSASDALVVTLNNVISGYNYSVDVAGMLGGIGAQIRLTNISGGSLSDAVVINFTIIKGATS